MSMSIDGNTCSYFSGNDRVKSSLYFGRSKMASRIDQVRAKLIIYGIIGLIAVVAIIFGISPNWHSVPAGYRGIVLEFGKPIDVAGEGFRLLTPGWQYSIVDIPVQTLKFEDAANAASSDIQDVKAIIAVNYHLDASRVLEIYTNLNVAWEDRIIRPNLQEVVKANTALYTAQDLIQQRPKVQIGIFQTFAERLKPYGVIVEAINIVDFKFSEAYTKAIENKVVAEQETLRERNVLDRVRIQAQQRVAEADGIAKSDISRANGSAVARILEAQAEARALQLLNEQLTRNGTQVLQLRSIEKWDGKLPIFITSGGQQIPIFIDINKLINQTAVRNP